MNRVKNVLVTVGGVVAVAAPAVVGAQVTSGPGFALNPSGSIWNVLNALYALFNQAIPYLIAIAVLFFLWGVLQYVINAADAEKRKAGQDAIIYGIIGIVVMLSFWGLVGFVQNSFGLGSGNNQITAPQLLTPQ